MSTSFCPAGLDACAVALPAALKIRDGWTKFALRAATDGLLPEEIRWRRDKQAFPTPEREWWELHREAIRRLFEQPRSMEFIDAAAVRGRLEEGYRQLLSPAGSLFKGSLRSDPLQADRLALEKLRYLNFVPDARLVDGRFASADGGSLLLVAESPVAITDSAGGMSASTPGGETPSSAFIWVGWKTWNIYWFIAAVAARASSMSWCSSAAPMMKSPCFRV